MHANSQEEEQWNLCKWSSALRVVVEWSSIYSLGGEGQVMAQVFSELSL